MINYKKCIICLSFIIIAYAPNIQAQYLPSPEIGVRVSYIDPFEIDEPFPKELITPGIGGQTFLRIYATNQFAFKIDFGFLPFSTKNEQNATDENGRLIGIIKEERRYIKLSIGGNYFLGKSEKFRPFIVTNIGYFKETVNVINVQITNSYSKDLFGFSSGIGFHFPVSPVLNIEFEILYNTLLKPQFLVNNFKYLSINFGVNFNLFRYY